MRIKIIKHFILIISITSLTSLHKAYCSNTDQQESLIQELLSKKFTYTGEQLINSIDELKSKVVDLNITGSSFERHVKANNSVKEIQLGVTIELPLQANLQSVTNSLLAAAYFPSELDPKTVVFTELFDQRYIHFQLAYAAHFRHVQALSYLDNIAKAYQLPSEHKFYASLDQYKKDKNEVRSVKYYLNKVDCNKLTETAAPLNIDLSDTESIERHFDVLNDILIYGTMSKS